MRRLLFLVLFLLPVLASAEQRTFFDSYDIAASSYTYCVTSEYRTGDSRVFTGTNATTPAADATLYGVSGTTPFALMSAGDEIVVTVGTTTSYRNIATKVSSVQVELDASVDWSGAGTTGYSFIWRARSCGTAATDGWIDVSKAKGKSKLVQIIVTTINATSLSFSVEGKVSGQRNATATLLGDFTYIAAGSNWLEITKDVDAIRVGVRYNTADTGAQSVSSYIVY